MRRLFSAVLLLAVSALAQQSTSSPQRDPTALAILQKALTSITGQISVPAITSAQITGSVAPVKDSGYPAGSFTWTVGLSSTGFEFRNVFQSGSDTQVFVSGHGAAAVSANGKTIRLLGHMSAGTPPNGIPLLMLLVPMLNKGYTVKQSTPLQIGNVLASHVQVSNDADHVTKAVTPQDWYFDPNTGLPLHVDYRSPDLFDALSWTPESRDFAGWKSIGGVLQPTQVINSSNGTPTTLTTISSVQLNVAVTPSQFDLP